MKKIRRLSINVFLVMIIMFGLPISFCSKAQAYTSLTDTSAVMGDTMSFHMRYSTGVTWGTNSYAWSNTYVTVNGYTVYTYANSAGPSKLTINIDVTAENHFVEGANTVVWNNNIHAYGTDATNLPGTVPDQAESSSAIITVSLPIPTYEIPAYAIAYGTNLNILSLPDAYWSWEGIMSGVLPVGTHTKYASYSLPNYASVSNIPITITITPFKIKFDVEVY